MNHLVAASRVRQDPVVLSLFLERLATCGAASFLFVDDNDDDASRQLLAAFARDHRTTVLPAPARAGQYGRSETTHVWDRVSCRRAGALYNTLIRAFLDQPDGSGVFFVDSDVLVPDGLATHLASLAVPVVCEVYWTRWQPNHPHLPQVWDTHPYLFDSADSIVRLREPGVHRVNGLGACTFVERRVLEAGVSFDPILGIPWEMEDRWFCVRAAAAGFTLWADTAMPPFHVYRQAQLAEARQWVQDGCGADYFRERWLDASWERTIRAAMRPRS